jgi:methionyl-tRNA formyltransferase
MKIVFFGSDDFAAAHLKALGKSSHKILACVTQPDKPKGRGLEVLPSPIKEWALENKVPVFQPLKISEKSFIKSLQDLKADVFVVIAYGKILPKEILNIPLKMPMNVHGSLLPKYRGAAPINWAVINGDSQTGLTIMKMNEQMDAGEIIAQEAMEISSMDNAKTLREKMMETGPAFLLKTLESVEKNKHSLTKQVDAEATFAPKLTRELGKIVWNKKALDIHNQIRGLVPWPAAYTFCKDKMLKFFSTVVITEQSNGRVPGEIMRIDQSGVLVSTGGQWLLIKEVQLESAKRMDAYSFALGHKLKIGMKFLEIPQVL